MAHRTIADWERCTAMKGGQRSLTGVHNWWLGETGKEDPSCHFCGSTPPKTRGAVIAEELTEALRIAAENRKRARLLKQVMNGPSL